MRKIEGTYAKIDRTRGRIAEICEKIAAMSVRIGRICGRTGGSSDKMSVPERARVSFRKIGRTFGKTAAICGETGEMSGRIVVICGRIGRTAERIGKTSRLIE